MPADMTLDEKADFIEKYTPALMPWPSPTYKHQDVYVVPSHTERDSHSTVEFVEDGTICYAERCQAALDGTRCIHVVLAQRVHTRRITALPIPQQPRVPENWG